MAEQQLSLRPPLPRFANSTTTTRGNIDDDGHSKNNKSINNATDVDHHVDDDNNNESLQIQLPPFFHELLGRLYLGCDILRVDCDTRFTALVLLHRYAQTILRCTTKKIGSELRNIGNDKSNNNDTAEDWSWSAGACLFLACKAEEEHRRLRDIINVVHAVLKIKAKEGEEDEDPKTTTTSSSPLTSIDLNLNLKSPPLDDAYWSMKRRLIREEQSMLRWLKFDVLVSHPHRAVLWILDQQQQQQQRRYDDGKIIENNNKIGNKYDAVTSSSMDSLAYVAFRRLNDGLFYDKALQHPVMTLACSALELALIEFDEDDAMATTATIKRLLFDSSTNVLWHTRYNVTTESLQTCKNDLEKATNLLTRSGFRKDD
jgi:hypothetical protein